MISIFRSAKKTGIILVIALIVLVTSFWKSAASDRIYTVGILNVSTTHAQVVEGFKAGMTELGYIEGKDVRYIYSGIIEPNEQVMDTEIRKQLSQGMDLLVAVANISALQAKKSLDGTDIPILASACGKMMEIGLVKDLKHPEANLTGVQVADTMAKALEWLVTITPDAKKIYLPYNPADEISLINLVGLEAIAVQMGIDLVLDEVSSVEDAVAAIENLPEDFNAIFRIPSKTLDQRNIELSQAAIRRGLPTGAGLPMDEDVLITFGNDPFEIGRQTARLAHQIRQGARPSDLPVETSEVYLAINLRTAEKVGLNIPNDILLQAKRIIR